MARIGFIGLGNMGGPMAANLATAGHDVRGYDVSTASLDALQDRGGRKAASAADAVEGAELVITMLPAGQHVRSVLAGEDAVFARAAPGTLIIDCSTIDVPTTRDMHAAAAGHGLAMLDAPVSGGVAGASAGTLTFMAGGEADAFARAQPVLQAMGKTVVHCGGPGAGQAAKVCNNLILGITMIGVSEAFALADRLGLSAQALFDVASKSSGQCWVLTSYCPVPGPVPASPANRGYQPGFAAALMLKDLTLAAEAAAQSGAPSVLGGPARDFYQGLMEQGLGDKDFSVVAKALLDSEARR